MRAAVRRGRVDLEEAVEDLILMLWGDADASIGNPHEYAIGVLLGGNGDCAAWRKFHGIREQIAQYLH